MGAGKSWVSQMAQIATDHRAGGLDEVDVAVMDLAEQVIDDATSVRETDLQRLHDLGLSQEEVMDVILAAAARCFFSKTLDALGGAARLQLSRAGAGPSPVPSRRPPDRRQLSPRHRSRYRTGIRWPPRLRLATSSHRTAAGC